MTAECFFWDRLLKKGVIRVDKTENVSEARKRLVLTIKEYSRKRAEELSHFPRCNGDCACCDFYIIDSDNSGLRLYSTDC